MAERSAGHLQKLWRSARPLSNAWLTFAHPKLKSQWKALESKSALTALSTSAEQLGHQDTPEALQRIDFMQKLLQPAQEILQARSDVKRRLQDNILNYIKNGQVFAYGFERPRMMASVPVELPEEVFRGRIDWENSAITHAGLHFVEVRLTTQRIRSEILTGIDPEDAAAPPSKGRPTVAPHIAAAVQALLESGQIDISCSARSHYPKIRYWLSQNAKDLPVSPDEVHDETIRLTFSPLFKELKKTKKQ